MGANTFFSAARAASAKEAFDALTSQSRYEDGHEYSGGIGMKSSFVHVGTVDSVKEARDLADRLIDEEDPRVDDKWGSAGCITINMKDGTTAYAFCGWASS